jgi:valyl-tRNA synthetase
LRQQNIEGQSAQELETPGSDAEDEWWVVARSYEEAQNIAQAELSLALESLGGSDGVEVGVELLQDEDVLDTWFSSGLFPLTALGWDGSNGSIDAFRAHDPAASSDPAVRRGNTGYPLSVMETGDDILFFWVARMAMMCHALTGVAPFREVLLHPLVRDGSGRKMSKSIGNVIDPLQVRAVLWILQCIHHTNDCHVIQPSDHRGHATRRHAC